MKKKLLLIMKNVLENIWLIVQITSVCLAAYWGITKWYLSDYQKMKPGFDADIQNPYGAPWGINSCSIGAKWVLNNVGQSPFKVHDINYQIIAIKNDSLNMISGEERDRSLGKIIGKPAFESAKYNLIKRFDEVSNGGSISRDILWKFRPSSEHGDIFKNHKFVIRVTAKIENVYKRALWCPFCSDEKDESIITSTPVEYCSKVSSNN